MSVPPPRPRAPAGFTLVEVLVALFSMALLAALAWRGLDGILRSRQAGREQVDRTLRISTVITQWEQDLQFLQAEDTVPALAFDGRTLRLVRRGAAGLHLVAWSLDGQAWVRWMSPPATRVSELQDAWLRSQQLASAQPPPLKLLEPVDDWQVYCYRINAWTNCQSTGDTAAAPPEPPASGASAPAPAREHLPSGVRLQLTWAGQQITRDIVLAPQR